MSALPPAVDLVARASSAAPRERSAAASGFRPARGRRARASAFVGALVAAVLLLTTGDSSTFVLSGQSLLAPAALLGAVAALAGYAIAGRRRAARMADAAQRFADVSRVRVHRRVRVAIHAVLLAVGAQAVLHGWFAESAERARAEDARIADLAAMQRMLSQRIGRLASALLAPDADPSPGLRELEEVLDRAETDARRLETMLHEKGTLLQADTLELNAAWAAWKGAHASLLASARALVHRDLPVEAALRTGSVASVQAQSDPALDAAQRLVDALSTLARERELTAVSQARTQSLLTLFVLLGLGVFVAEPAARSVKRQHAFLAERMEDLQRLALVAERTTNIVVLTDERQRILWVNDAFRRITGYDGSHALGQTPEQLLVDRQSNTRTLARVREALARGEGARVQLLNRTREGRELWLDVDIQPLRDAGGKLTGFVDVASDITERRRAQADLRVAAIAFDSLEAIAITDARRAILRVNPAFTRITGYQPYEAIGRTPGRLLGSGRQGREFYRAMHSALERERHWQGELWNRRKDGELYLEWLSVTAVTDDEGNVENYVAVFTDITQKRQADETIHRLAYYDPLTELPNRRLLRDRLQLAMQSSERSRRHAAVLFIDLDRFKILNDTRGHEVGDLLLVEVARRLTAGVRASDTVARQGGDEFVIVVGDLGADEAQAKEQVERIATGLRASLSQPYQLAGHEHYGTASIGIHLFVGGQHTVDELLERADVAMYQAKRSGRNRLGFFDARTHAAVTERAALEADLRIALPRNQLQLHFQPQIDERGDTIGAEVLLRWMHPQRGLISPADFIPVAEESELIVGIGDWVLQRACAQLASWSEREGFAGLQLSVNVSPKQFRQADFVDRVRTAMHAAGIAPGRLKLELTESLVALDIDETVATMRRIRELGVGFSIDDFGTGHSSLTYLARLPIDQLKIDQSFVRKLPTHRSDAIVVQTIIGMAASLSIEVIAEGVETPEQRAFLEANGCRRFQGYLYGRPAPIGEFERRLRESLSGRGA